MKIYGQGNDFWWECRFETYTDGEAEPLIRSGKIYSLGVKTGSFNTNTRLIITWHYHERIPLNFKKGDMQYLFADYFKRYEDEFLDTMRKRIGGNYNVLWKHYVFSDVEN